MPVTRVTELADERSMEINDRYGFIATRVFEVLTNNKAIGPSYVMFASGIPRVNAFYRTEDEVHEGLFVRRVKPRQDAQDLFRWRVTVDYSTQTTDPLQTVPGIGGGGGGGGAGGGGGQPTNDDPITEPPRWAWGKVEDVAIMTHDLRVDSTTNFEGRAVVNSAGQPFSPRPTRDDSRQSLVYVRNERRYDHKEMQGYWDTVNERPFLDYEVGQAKCKSITGQSDYRNGRRFFVVTYVFEFKEPDWDLRLIDQGTEYLEVSGIVIKSKPFLKNNVQSVTLLDGHGQPHTDTDNPVTLRFRRHYKSDFRKLGIYLF